MPGTGGRAATKIQVPLHYHGREASRLVDDILYADYQAGMTIPNIAIKYGYRSRQWLIARLERADNNNSDVRIKI